MIINSRPKLQLLLFLLFTTVSFAMQGPHAGGPRGVPALTSSAIQVAAQERAWKPGDRVEVQWKGDWYQANVIEVKGNQYKIHRSEEHTSELQSPCNLVCRLLLEKKNK